MTIFVVADQRKYVPDRRMLKYLGFRSKEKALRFYEKTTDWYGVGVLEVQISNA